MEDQSQHNAMKDLLGIDLNYLVLVHQGAISPGIRETRE